VAALLGDRVAAALVAAAPDRADLPPERLGTRRHHEPDHDADEVEQQPGGEADALSVALAAR
jgi:hypothetical protein